MKPPGKLLVAVLLLLTLGVVARGAAITRFDRDAPEANSTALVEGSEGDDSDGDVLPSTTEEPSYSESTESPENNNIDLSAPGEAPDDGDEKKIKWKKPKKPKKPKWKKLPGPKPKQRPALSQKGKPATVYRPQYRPAYRPQYRPAYRPQYRPAYRPVYYRPAYFGGGRWGKEDAELASEDQVRETFLPEETQRDLYR